MITDPLYYVIAVPMVLITGISKGGFGMGLGIMSVPAMSLVVPPLQAAGIMLPILCLMDLVGVWTYRRTWDRRLLRHMAPAALVGIAVGWALAGALDERWIRLVIGLIALAFALDFWRGRRIARAAARPSAWKGGFWSGVSGFTSFVGHAGGPPLSIYLLPLGLDKTIFVGTTVMFFAAVNYVKLVPYAWLGQLGPGNLATALVLAPLAPLGMWLGIRLHHGIAPGAFIRICYGFVFVVGLKLTWDGLKLGAGL